MSGPTVHRIARDGGNPVLRLIGLISTICGVLAATMIVVAVGITCQMIYVRFVLNLSTVWQTEAVVYLMVSATILGLPYVQRLRGHVNVELLPMLLPQSMRKGLAILVSLASLTVIGVMLYYGYELWEVAWSRGWRSDTVWGPPLWIPYLPMVVGFALYWLQLAADLYAVIVGIDEPFALDEAAIAASAAAATNNSGEAR